MAFNIGDTVSYGLDGVCRITQIVEKEFRDQPVQYYVLVPVFNSRSTIFVPVENDALASRMRYAHSAEELSEIMLSAPDDDTLWTDNESERKVRFKEVLHSGDVREIIRLVRTLYHHRESQKAIGKKLHMADDRFFKDAERLLYDEYAAAFGISPIEALPHIMKLFEG